VLLIVLRRPDGTFGHLSCGSDDDDTRKLYDLLTTTRSAAAIPIMELCEVDVSNVLQTHLKEL
jgi:hypothetical protein